jgi:hypothetical protein
MITGSLPSCQPMPGPPGAAWPSARPGVDYCGPYPQCCPHAVDTVARHAGLLGWPATHPFITVCAAIVGAVIIAAVIDSLRVRRRIRRRQTGRAW